MLWKTPIEIADVLFDRAQQMDFGPRHYLLPRLLALSLVLPIIQGRAMEPAFADYVPHEQTNAVLHNPDMGWVLYENYPLDQDPHGSSSLLTLPQETFPEVDAVALMFSWEDVERRPDEYDFSKVDFAYHYWAGRGKEIQLRLSATTLMFWANRNPPAGRGTPEYVLARMSPTEKQTRTSAGQPYAVENARNVYYRQRLAKFLRAVNDHFSRERPVTLIDLRGFGLWGEWHSGFKYETLKSRRAALKSIIQLWSDALPRHQLALSYSYDPDGPPGLYAGPYRQFDPSFTTNYHAFLHYSAFDYALTRPNITFRRDGCGGAVHSNERQLNEESFRLGRGPMFSEFVDGYWQSRTGGTNWVNWKIEDALSLHPNYINLLGWQGADARDFVRERPDLVAHGLRTMGYRLVPTQVRYPDRISSGQPFRIQMNWVNRGVGRSMRDFQLSLRLLDQNGHTMATSRPATLNTSRWVAGPAYPVAMKAAFDRVPAGVYQLGFNLRDPQSGKAIALPISDGDASRTYRVGRIEVVVPQD